MEISDNSNKFQKPNLGPTIVDFGVDLRKEKVPGGNKRELKSIWDNPMLYPRVVHLITPEDPEPALVPRDPNAGHFHDAMEPHGPDENHFFDASEHHEEEPEYHDADTWHGDHPPGHDGDL